MNTQQSTGNRIDQATAAVPYSPGRGRVLNPRAIGALFAVALCLALAGCPGVNSADHANVDIDVSPIADTIVFSSAAADLFLFDPESQSVRRLTDTPARETHPAFSPDGLRIAFASLENGEQASGICSLELQDLKIRQLTRDEAVYDVWPSFSSDGSMIVFARAHLRRPKSMGGWTWDHWDVYVMNSDGTNVRRVTNQQYYELSSPQFIADGKSIVFSGHERQTRNVCTEIYRVAIDGEAEPHRLTLKATAESGAAAAGIDPDVSSDGASMLFVSDRQKPFLYDLYVMNENGKDVHSLNALTVGRYNQRPHYSASGNSVYFLGATEWSTSSSPLYCLWAIDADGSNPRRIATKELFDAPLTYHRSGTSRGLPDEAARQDAKASQHEPPGKSAPRQDRRVPVLDLEVERGMKVDELEWYERYDGLLLEHE